MPYGACQLSQLLSTVLIRGFSLNRNSGLQFKIGQYLPSLYQTLQAADWSAGLVGRLGAIWAEPVAYAENDIFRKYFEQRRNHICRRSGIRS